MDAAKGTLKKSIAIILSAIIIASGGLIFRKNAVNADTYNEGIVTFVNSLYSDCLGRTADSTGLNDWCNKLATGQITGKQCAYGFFFSQEFLDRTFTPESLIDTFYRVFLNRGADPDGKEYWLSKVNTNMNFTAAVALLFDGFADSTEFANKCASYGIIAGGHIDTSTVVTTANNSASQPVEEAFYDVDMYAPYDEVNSGMGRPAASSAALDAYWTSRGWEIWYIDLGNGATQKCYARFYDTASMNDLINQYRVANGLQPYIIINDPNDERVQWSRQRAVEIAYNGSHTRPNGGRFGSSSENLTNMPPPTGAFGIWRNSAGHRAAMLGPYSAISSAACRVIFVNPDGVTISDDDRTGVWFHSPNANGCGTATVLNLW